MIIELSKEFYELAKSIDWSEIEEYIKFDDRNNTLELEDCDIMLDNHKGDYYIEDSVNALLSCIDAEVCRSGLSDDQNEVLLRGRQLYALYDGIYYSLPVKEDGE